MIALSTFVFYDHINNVSARVTPERERAVVRPYGFWTQQQMMDAVNALTHEHIGKLVMNMEGYDLTRTAVEFGAFCESLRVFHRVEIVYAGIPVHMVQHCYSFYSGRLYDSIEEALDSYLW